MENEVIMEVAEQGAALSKGNVIAFGVGTLVGIAGTKLVQVIIKKTTKKAVKEPVEVVNAEAEDDFCEE